MHASRHPDSSGWSVILWDLDGTITDSGAEIINRISFALHEVNWPVPPEAELRKLIGPPMYDSLFNGLRLPADLARKATDAAHAKAKQQEPGYLTTTYDGLPSVLAELSESGIPMAVASSKNEWHVHRILDHFNLSKYFTVRTGSDESAGRTHKADVIQEALRRLEDQGVSLSSPIMVGDRGHDLEGATAHGIPAVIVAWGYHDDEPIDQALAHPQTPTQLLEILR